MSNKSKALLIGSAVILGIVALARHKSHAEEPVEYGIPELQNLNVEQYFADPGTTAVANAKLFKNSRYGALVAVDHKGLGGTMELSLDLRVRFEFITYSGWTKKVVTDWKYFTITRTIVVPDRLDWETEHCWVPDEPESISNSFNPAQTKHDTQLQVIARAELQSFGYEPLVLEKTTYGGFRYLEFDFPGIDI